MWQYGGRVSVTNIVVSTEEMAMCLHPDDDFTIPAETIEVAWAALPKGNAYLRLRDALGPLFCDADFADLFAERGRPAETPWRLALVTILAFGEGLTDRQAAEAVATRLDWKYVLGLELRTPGFDYSVLSEFRGRLLEHGAERRLLDQFLAQVRAVGLVRDGGRQRTDSTHVLAAVRRLNRLECVHETFRAALETLAEAAPAWLVTHVPAAWFDRYSHRLDPARYPKSRAAQLALGTAMGADFYQLLTALFAPTAPPALRTLPAVIVLWRVWVQQYDFTTPTVCWRTSEELPGADTLIKSPYDPDARYSRKRDETWVGYKVHLTETCDDNLPHLIVNVETTAASQPDFNLLPTIHDQLAARELLPGTHLVDAGYVDGAVFADSHDRQIDLIAPAPPDTSWQGKTDQGYSLSAFTLDWEAATATCPQGQTTTRWSTSTDRHGNPVIQVRFARAVCAACAVRAQCTRAKTDPRTLKVHQPKEHAALQTARDRQATPEFTALYTPRRGVEGTIAQAANAFAMRQTRYCGRAKTHLQHLCTAVAINLQRLAAWLPADPPPEPRPTRFGTLRSRWEQLNLQILPSLA